MAVNVASRRPRRKGSYLLRADLRLRMSTRVAAARQVFSGWCQRRYTHVRNRWITLSAAGAARTLSYGLTDRRAMAELRARIAGTFILIISVLLLISIKFLPGPLEGRKTVVLAIGVLVPFIGVAVIAAGSRLTDLMFVLSQCLVEILLIPVSVLNQQVEGTPPGSDGQIVPILISAVFAGRRRHVAVQVAVSLFATGVVPALSSGTERLAPVILGEAFAYIGSALVVRLLRELAEDGMRQAERAIQQAELGEITDPLTGLPNRRGFERAGSGEWNRRAHEGLPLAVLLIDIDHFKKINDTRGHAVGDALLRDVGEQLTGLLREGDAAYRLGGEEFAILARCRHGEALIIAERVRSWIEQSLPVTVSIGVVEAVPHPLPDVVATLWRAIDRADQGLYTAKRSGRNKVVSVDAV